MNGDEGISPGQRFPHSQHQPCARSLGRSVVPVPLRGGGGATQASTRRYPAFVGAMGGKRARLRPPQPTREGQLALPPPHPLCWWLLICCCPASVRGSLGFPTGFPPGYSASLALVPAAPGCRVPLHRRRRLCSRIKPLRQSQNAFAIAGANSSGSELWLRYRRSDPPSWTCRCHAFYSSKRDGGSGPCVLRLPGQSCIRSHRKPPRQGTRVLALCCNMVSLKNELFCLPRPKHGS